MKQRGELNIGINTTIADIKQYQKTFRKASKLFRDVDDLTVIQGWINLCNLILETVEKNKDGGVFSAVEEQEELRTKDQSEKK